jgi:hypothetical protein
MELGAATERAGWLLQQDRVGVLAALLKLGSSTRSNRAICCRCEAMRAPKQAQLLADPSTRSDTPNPNHQSHNQQPRDQCCYRLPLICWSVTFLEGKNAQTCTSGHARFRCSSQTKTLMGATLHATLHGLPPRLPQRRCWQQPMNRTAALLA